MAKEQKASTLEGQTKWKVGVMSSQSSAEATTGEKKEESASIGTTEKLFADLMPVPEKLPSKKEDASKEEAKEPEKAEKPVEKTEEPDTFDLDAFKEKKVKVKIDGREREVTLKDLIKGYQTDQYLTQKGQRVAEEAKLIEEFKKNLKVKPQDTMSEEEDEVAKTVKPYLSPLEKELNSLKETMATLQPTIGPMVYQNNLKKVESALKEEGFDDFMVYVPKIEDHIFSLPIEKQVQYDNLGSFMNLYHMMKAKDLITASKNPPTQKVDVRKEPKIVKIESESGSSGADDWSTQYNMAFAKAKKTGDWSEVFRLKEGA